MNTRHAGMILAILREGSFTAAAKALSITQPTLSQTVRQIETQLGEPIFVRGKTPVQLTQAGELYVHAARRIIQAETQLQEAITMLHGRTEGTLRIGVMNQRSNELLPQIIPDFFSAYYNRAIIRANLKQNEEALKDMNYVIANVPDHALAYYNRGIIYENLGQPTLAIQDYSHAINLQPNLLEAYHYRGIVRYGMKDLDGALADYNKAISLGLKSSAIYFNRGVIFHQKGQLSDAIESYSRSIEIDPSNARAYYNRAISKLIVDNYKEALQDLEISKRLGYSKAAEVIAQYY